VIEEKQFDAIVTGFYKAATGALDWNDALTPIHQAFRTRQTVLHSVDVATGKLVQQLHSPSANPGVLEYVRHWHEVDPRRNLLLKQPELMIDRWWHCHEHFDDRFAARDKFYQQFLVAQDSRYMSTTTAMVSGSVMVAFAHELPADRGPLSNDEVHVLDRLSRHIFEALRMHERVRRLAAQAIAGYGLLDAFPHPMWLLDANGSVFYANTVAKTLLARRYRRSK
jgi:PAS domain-containing protein